VEAADRQIHVDMVVCLIGERGAACRTKATLRDRRAGKAIGLALPRHDRFLDVPERNRDSAGGPLAHTAVAEIGFVAVDPHTIPPPPALAPAGHPRPRLPPTQLLRRTTQLGCRLQLITMLIMCVP